MECRISQATMVICMPDEDLRNDMATSASVLHETNHSEFHVFGARIFDEVFSECFRVNKLLLH